MNMGFEPQGENLSLIMVEGGKGKNRGRYIIETRMDELIEGLNIDKNRITGVSHKSVAWNIKMMATTALLCAFSIAPYIHLNLGANKLILGKSTTWVFPVLRSTGGFITATLIQLLIQRRITTLSDQYLVKRDQLCNRDEETAGNTKKYQMISRRIAPTWLLLFLLLIGLLASVVGYVGCFSVVQNSTSTSGPVSWLCLEAGLSVVRLAIWAWNPTKDDAPPLEIIQELEKYEPLPTCNKDSSEILEYKVLPLTRARDFLKIITSFAGLIEPFSNPDLSLYYTFTRNRPSKKRLSWWSRFNERENAKNPGERTLYITVFDHKERTTRVYTRNNNMDIFYSTKSDAPLVDVGHFLLEVEIDAKIHPQGDPVSSDSIILDSLRKHHRSILEHVQYRLGTADVRKTYAIENSWTMKAEDTISILQRLREDNGDNWERDVKKGRDRGRTEESLVSDYFMLSSIESERRLLDEKRGKWIARRMEMIIRETDFKQGYECEMGMDHRVNKQAVEKKPAPKYIDGQEWCCMEMLLVCEVRGWEQLFWDKFKAFLDQIGNDRVEEKKRLEREWRTNCWKRLDSQMRAALKRLENVDNMKDKDDFLKSLAEEWTITISQFFEGVEEPDLKKLSELMNEIDADDMIERRLRIENEIEDTKFRLKRGSDLGRFDQFWDDDILFRCRYSQSKWLNLRQNSTVPLEIYLHALKRNKNITHISFRGFDDDQIQAIICDLPWVTSMSLYHESSRTPPAPPAIHRDPLFIKSSNYDLITFAKEITGKLDSSSTYNFLDIGNSPLFLLPSVCGKARVLISFVAPKSGKRLTLRVKHSGRRDRPLEVTLGSTKIQLNFKSESSLTIDDITLYSIRVPGPSESDHLLFEPEIRNDIVIQFRGTVEEHGHFLHDVVLLDEAGLEYMPYSGSSSILSN